MSDNIRLELRLAGQEHAPKLEILGVNVVVFLVDAGEYALPSDALVRDGVATLKCARFGNGYGGRVAAVLTRGMGEWKLSRWPHYATPERVENSGSFEVGDCGVTLAIEGSDARTAAPWQYTILRDRVEWVKPGGASGHWEIGPLVKNGSDQGAREYTPENFLRTMLSQSVNVDEPSSVLREKHCHLGPCWAMPTKNWPKPADYNPQEANRGLAFKGWSTAVLKAGCFPPGPTVEAAAHQVKVDWGAEILVTHAKFEVDCVSLATSLLNQRAHAGALRVSEVTGNGPRLTVSVEYSVTGDVPKEDVLWIRRMVSDHLEETCGREYALLCFAATYEGGRTLTFDLRRFAASVELT